MQEPNPDAREEGKTLIAEGKAAGPTRTAFIYVNNRLEGNALETVDAMTAEMDKIMVRKNFKNASAQMPLHGGRMPPTQVQIVSQFAR